MTTPTFNLTLPAHPFSKSQAVNTRYLHGDRFAQHSAWERVRDAALVELVKTISPELAAVKANLNGFRSVASFQLGDSSPEVSVRVTSNGQLEVRLDAGYSDGRNTFRRFAIRDNVIDTKVIEGTRELVKRALEIVEENAAAEVRKADAATEKARAFAHSSEVVKTAGLTWGFEHNHEGRVDLNGYTQRAEIKGRMMTVELNGLDVDQLPAVLAFVRSLS